MNELKEKVKEVVETASKEFNIEIPEYKILVNLTGHRTLGQYQASGPIGNVKHTLRFHPKAYSDCKETYMNTIIHEVAHFIVFLKYGYDRNIQPHGKEWKEIAKKLGLEDPKAINKNNVFKLNSPKRKVCYCDCMEHQVSTRMFNIIKKGDSPRICKNCYTELRIEK